MSCGTCKNIRAPFGVAPVMRTIVDWGGYFLGFHPKALTPQPVLWDSYVSSQRIIVFVFVVKPTNISQYPT